MNKKIASILILTALSITTNAYAKNKASICEDYRRQISEYCKKGYVGYLSGTAGACLGAQIGLAIHKC